MASYSQPRVLTFKATAALTAYRAVKPGADDQHIQKATAASDKQIGICQNTVTAAEDLIEVALPGGGAKMVLGTGGASWGDLLTADSNGAGVVTTSNAARVIAMAMEDGVEGDVIAVEVMAGIV